MYYKKALESELEDNLFKSPTKEYRACPFWAWNSTLDTEYLEEQICAFREMGFGGFFMHPRIGLRTKYLGEEFFEADKGKEYILISLKIENKSDSKISYNELDWELVDSNGDEKSFAIWGNDNNSALESGNLNPGGTKTGTIAFEIPKGDKNLTLNYYDNIFNDERTFEFKIVD